MKKILTGFVTAALCAALCLGLTGCGDGSLKDLIGRDAAKQIALKDAGFPERWVIELDVDFEHEDQEHVYDVNFINATTKYSYTIDGETGEILSHDTSPLFPESD